MGVHRMQSVSGQNLKRIVPQMHQMILNGFSQTQECYERRSTWLILHTYYICWIFLKANLNRPVMQRKGYASCANSPETQARKPDTSPLGLPEGGRNQVWSLTLRIPRSSACQFIVWSPVNRSTHKRVSGFQLRIDGRGERMNQFWPIIQLNE
jgi:hypothetical protein